jgi:uncharacterized peroxidase-related enzyme
MLRGGGIVSYLGTPQSGEKDPPILESIHSAFGFVPNTYRDQKLRPDLIEAQIDLVGALLVKEGALTRQQKEYVFLVCAAANLSTYCVTLHCEMVRMLGLSGPEPEQIAINHTATNLPVRDKALLNFALKLNNQQAKVSVRDIDTLRTYRFSDAAILETVLMVGLAKFSNVVAFGLGTVPDFEPVRIPRADGHARTG